MSNRFYFYGALATGGGIFLANIVNIKKSPMYEKFRADERKRRIEDDDTDDFYDIGGYHRRPDISRYDMYHMLCMCAVKGVLYGIITPINVYVLTSELFLSGFFPEKINIRRHFIPGSIYGPR